MGAKLTVLELELVHVEHGLSVFVFASCFLF